jgi:hypothetical protein
MFYISDSSTQAIVKHKRALRVGQNGKIVVKVQGQEWPFKSEYTAKRFIKSLIKGV